MTGADQDEHKFGGGGGGVPPSRVAVFLADRKHFFFFYLRVASFYINVHIAHPYFSSITYLYMYK